MEEALKIKVIKVCKQKISAKGENVGLAFAVVPMW